MDAATENFLGMDFPLGKYTFVLSPEFGSSVNFSLFLNTDYTRNVGKTRLLAIRGKLSFIEQAGYFSEQVYIYYHRQNQISIAELPHDVNQGVYLC